MPPAQNRIRIWLSVWDERGSKYTSASRRLPGGFQMHLLMVFPLFHLIHWGFDINKQHAHIAINFCFDTEHNSLTLPPVYPHHTVPIRRVIRPTSWGDSEYRSAQDDALRLAFLFSPTDPGIGHHGIQQMHLLSTRPTCLQRFFVAERYALSLKAASVAPCFSTDERQLLHWFSMWQEN